MIFGNRIKELREDAKLLQRQVAARLELDTPLLSKIERGERRARHEHVAALAKIFNVDEKELITLWLADQVLELVKDQVEAENALSIASKELKNSKK
ncbi:helix-turn-helix domain-containing protein [Phaeocystidibacter luteus]|uniref:Helix-turn-helix transcriptional regulator n=1 Tax=Phaeocystidibacter luteus TaxID=911197 RepID=A0A6N6RDV9_9FLAO|nr:helix-turn-helix transcriptional regulator [Phaeocystidibacter luteus]KAB2807667.1 helix-turn-helix transcriptional regulator [Phaeocystidibacter luteus]